MPPSLSPINRALISALAFTLASTADASAQDITITEFMASNASTAVPGQVSGQFHDWIELRNNTGASLNLVGWHLTDDSGIPFKWTFPSTTIAAGAHKIVFASGTGTPANGVLHTNFALASRGGHVALTRPDLSIASSFDYPKQFTDVTYGTPGSGGAPVHLATATPGSVNGSSEYLFVADTNFSHKRGHYNSPIAVAISTATAGATIRYTTDGSEPAPTGNGTTYSSPINITTTTVLRALAFRSGYAPTNIDTQTYIFPEAVTTQTGPPGYPTNWQDDPNANYDMDTEVSQSALYHDRLIAGLSDLPTLSVATQVNQVFGPGGIYTNSTNDTLEAPVSAEYFTPSGTADGVNSEAGFQIDCGFKVQGGASRNPGSSNKHSFSLRFRTQYGDSKLNYKLFPDSTVEEFDGVQLRAMYNNSWIHSNSAQRQRATMIRDQWIRDSLIAMGQADGGHGHFVHLYINGLYWGVYNLHERLDNDHYAAYNGGDPATIDSQNPASYAPSFNAMKSLVSGGDWAAISAAIDIDSYIDYYLIQHFGKNDDLKNNGNWRAAGGGSSNAPWHFYAWDSERVLENVSNTGPLGVTQDGAGLIDSLDDHEEFRIRFADRVQQHLFNGGALTSEKCLARWTRYSDSLDRAIIAESARWGDDRRAVPYTRDIEWITEVNNLKNNFFRSATPNRTSYMITKFQNESWPSGDRKLLNTPAPALEVNNSPQHGGQISPADLVGFSSSPGTIYYTTDGSDPRVPPSGGVPVILLDAGDACTAFIPTDGSLGLAWTGRVFDDSAWLHGTTGVGYDSPGGGYLGLINLDVIAMRGNNASCYIRVPFNIPDQATLNAIGTLSLNLKYEDGFVAWINGTKVSGDNDPASPTWDSSTSGVNRNETAAVTYTAFDATAGKGGLVVGANTLAIQLLNSSSGSSDLLCVPQLSYSTSSATGVSPIATAFAADFQLPATKTLKARALNGTEWSALTEATFIVEPPAAPGDLIISELAYHPADPTQAELDAGQALTPPLLFNDGSFEFIEFLNVAANAINLDGVHFTSGIDYTFGPVIMLPGERVVLARNLAGFAARHGSPAGIQVVGPYLGALNNNTETLAYAAAGGATIQSFAYDDSGSWPGRADGAASSLELANPDGDPALSSSWRPSSEFNGSPGSAGAGPDARIAINEVLAHTDLPEVDAIELYNRTGAPIDLSGWYLSDTRDHYTRFRIPPATTIPADGFIAFDEGDFNSSGTPNDFALSGSRGDDVYLLEANAAGVPTRFADHVEFGGSFNGITLGRWPDGSGQLVPMTANTLEAPNSGPLISSVILTEIMYHPGGTQPGHEFIEIFNRGSASENLDHWTLRGGVDFDFTSAHQLPAGGTLVLVSFDPADTPSAAAFRAAYSIDASVALAGPWRDGFLNNGGDLIKLQRPDTPPADDPAYFPQIIADISDFDDDAPWPTAADGTGASLQRTLPPAYGSFATSWIATAPTPGTPPLSDDLDGDGIPALIEYALNLDPNAHDADRLPRPIIEGNSLTYSYPRDTTKTDITYQVEVSGDLKIWIGLADSLISTDGDVETRKASIALSGQQFLRLKVTRN